MADVRMRTLLDESIPPYSSEEQTFLSPEPETRARRIFSPNPVLTRSDDLVEVGLGGTVKATPGAGAEQAKPALARGVASSETRQGSSNGMEHARPSRTRSKEAAPAV